MTSCPILVSWVLAWLSLCGQPWMSASSAQEKGTARDCEPHGKGNVSQDLQIQERLLVVDISRDQVLALLPEIDSQQP